MLHLVLFRVNFATVFKQKIMTITSVLIVGSGPAGIGVASLLSQTGIDYVVLEKNDIGSSFTDWPKNMEMITPSFPSNAFGQIDLNSICEGTSPAFTFSKEHLTGDEYTDYLKLVSNFFQINVETGTEVIEVKQQKKGWRVETNQGPYSANYVIWAAGEFKNPQIKNIKGAELCIHSSYVRHPERVEGDHFVIIGGYESGVQLAYDLVQNQKEVTLIDPEVINDTNTSDPSKSLSPYTCTKYNKIQNSPLYSEVVCEVRSVSKKDGVYQLELDDESVITTERIPICATGFSLVDEPIKDLISYRKNGTPILIEETDEFFGQENLYLTGPSVRHDDHIFCFIYKFRQRFGVIVEDIMRKEDYKEEDITKLVERWKVNGMYLSDLSCCDTECVC